MPTWSKWATLNFLCHSLPMLQSSVFSCHDEWSCRFKRNFEWQLSLLSLRLIIWRYFSPDWVSARLNDHCSFSLHSKPFHVHTHTHRRTRNSGKWRMEIRANGIGVWKFGQILRKIKKIRADLSQNRLNSCNLITILQKIRANFQLSPWKASVPYAYAHTDKIVYSISSSL